MVQWRKPMLWRQQAVMLQSFVNWNSSSTVHKVGTQKVKPRVHVKPQKKMCQHHSTAFKCSRCGGEHSVVNCKHANRTCRYCSKQGHIERHVLKRRRIQRESMERKWTFYMKMTDMTSIIMNRCYTYIAFNNVNKIDPIILQLMIKGQPLNMELDTWSSVSIIPDTFYRRNLSDVPL